jgi:hypothetical protein
MATRLRREGIRGLCFSLTDLILASILLVQLYKVQQLRAAAGLLSPI